MNHKQAVSQATIEEITIIISNKNTSLYRIITEYSPISITHLPVIYYVWKEGILSFLNITMGESVLMYYWIFLYIYLGLVICYLTFENRWSLKDINKRLNGVFVKYSQVYDVWLINSLWQNKKKKGYDYIMSLMERES